MPTAYRETQIRGSLEFPYKIYTSIIPDFIMAFPMHWHDEFEVIWIKEGHVWVNVQSKIYLCGPGDILIVPPKYIHSFKQYKNERVKYYNIIFDFEGLEPVSDSIISRKYFSKMKNAPHLKEIFYPSESEINNELMTFINVFYETRHFFEKSEMVIKGNLYLMLDKINDLIVPDSENFRTTKKIISRLKPVFTKVEESYNEDLDVDEMAELACLSRSHFMTMFKKVSGLTFINYLNMVRLEKAKKLIIDSELSILEISEECGFHNFSYFIRVFKKQYGKTPLQIRKLH